MFKSAEDMTKVEIDELLERYDQTEPDLQRRIIAQFVIDAIKYKDALEESVKLQSHYANLLNMHDGGQRMQFKSGDEWVKRLAYVRDNADAQS